MTAYDPTTASFQKLLDVEPALTTIAPLSVLRSLPDRTLFHAGPPLKDASRPPAPLLNGILAAIVLEGWASCRESAAKVFQTGSIGLASAQDFGIVTPLAFVAGPNTFCLKVEDLAQPGQFIIAPLNDGPPPIAIRFGGYRDEGVAIVRGLIDGVGTDLSRALRAPFPLLSAMAASLADGDDLHGRVSAMQQRVLASLETPMSPKTTTYLESAGQFALNVVMAAAALMIGAGAGIAESNMVVACGGNGESIGYKLANTQDAWRKVPATRPIGPRMPGLEETIPLPAIGDSAVIDALGFGAACLRYCPELAASLRGQFDSGQLPTAFLDDRAHAPFIGAHPALANHDIRLGLDLTRQRDCLGIMLGMVHETGEHGLIGRGIAPWPEA